MMNQSNEMPRNLSGKVAVITGAASGIGLATAKVFLDQGATVFGVDIAPEISLEHTHANDASRFQFHRCDLTAPGAPDEVIVACQRSFSGKIDILVNAAGIFEGWASADTVTDDEWNRVMSINLEAPVKLMRAVLPALKQQKSGAIVNVCSKAGSSGASAGIAYTASKHALAGVTKNVAWRFRDEGIRCNAVSPGATITNIGTSMKEECFDMDAYKVFLPPINLHCKLGPSGGPVAHIEAVDVAYAIAFLASEQARMISGVLLPIDTAWSTL